MPDLRNCNDHLHLHTALLSQEEQQQQGSGGPSSQSPSAQKAEGMLQLVSALRSTVRLGQMHDWHLEAVITCALGPMSLDCL